jgi:GAF domain-containing protein
MTATLDDEVADLRRANAELQQRLDERTSERDEAEAQKAAMAEVLEVINSSAGNLAPVFDAMLEKAMLLCGAAFGELRTYDGERFRLAATRGVPSSYVEYYSRHVSGVYGPGTAPARILAGERIVHVPDLTATEPYQRGDPDRRALVDLGGARAIVLVPLLKDDAVSGYIMIFRQEPGPFSDKQIALLQNFAAQAVIAMENARLITETREALEQQTATAEVLGVINSSPGDLTPVFDAILEKAHALCGATFGSLQTYDGEFFHMVASRGLPDTFLKLLREPFRPDPNSFEERLVRGDDLVHIPDVTRLGPLPDDPLSHTAVETAGLRTLLLLPLRKEAALVGYVASARSEVRPFSDKQIALLQNFAAQAVIAIENARLITETRDALEQQTATAEVLRVINSSPGHLAPVFDAMLDKATRLSAAAFGILWTYDGERFQAVAFHDVPPAYMEFLREPQVASPVAPLGRVARGEAFALVPDLAAEEYHERAGFLVRQGLSLGGFRTVLAVPMRKDGSLLGAITIYRREVQPFSEKQIALLLSFAAQAVIAMENARLITETREALEQQTATAEVLQVINSSPGDLAPVFDAILEKAMRLCRADQGDVFYRFDDGAYRMGGASGVPDAYREIEANVVIIPGRDTLVGRVAMQAAPVQIVDVQADPEYLPKEDARIGNVQTMLGVPLLRDGVPVGVFGLGRRRVEAFSDREIALVTGFAAQAVIAMENARLITETREALDQQTATAEVLQVINASPGHLTPVFDAMLDKAMRLCNAAFGYMMTYDGEQFTEVAHRGLPSRFADYLPRMHQPGPHGMYARIRAGAPFVQVSDLSEGEVYRTSPLRKALVLLRHNDE